MHMIDFKELLASEEYRFLKENHHLGANVIFLALGGSYAYGTNQEDSDVDIRGCFLNSKSELIGMGQFEQYTDDTTDTTLYCFHKLISLLIHVNPNTIELLGCRPEHYLSMTSIGKELIDHRKLFLSRRAIDSFSGYASQQLRRLQNALARDNYPHVEKERHILGSITSAMRGFKDKYQTFDNGNIKLYLDASHHADWEKEIYMDIRLDHYPLRDYKNMWSEMNTVVKSYEKLGKRNHKKDDLHLNKHAMHLIRLHLMCLDILEQEEIITYREKDIDLLMSIRHGTFQKEDGTFRQEFFDLLNELEKKQQYAQLHTNLPEEPDLKRIEELVISVNEKVIKDEIR